MHIGQKSDALQQIGIGPFAADAKVGIIMSLVPFAQLPANGQIPERVLLPQRDVFDRINQISAIGLIGQIGIVLVKSHGPASITKDSMLNFGARPCAWRRFSVS